MYLDPHSKDGWIYVCLQFKEHLDLMQVLGLFECFKRALVHAGIADSNWQNMLIGFGCA